MSIIKSVFIYGCGEGTVGAAIAMALAGKAVHVFACSPSISEMSQLEGIPNVSTLSLNPISHIAFQTAKEQVATKLNGGKLNIVINAGLVGHEDVRDCTGEKRGRLWGSHISSMKYLALAFRPLLIDSHGTIINLTSYEMLLHELIISKSHCSYYILFNPLTNWQESLPNAPESMASHAARLCNELEPLGIKLLNVGHEGERAGEDMVSDGPRAWSDVPALAEDIIDDIFRLPGTGRVL